MDRINRNSEVWKDEIRRELVCLFNDDHDGLARLLLFLDEEDKIYKDNIDRPYAPQWKSLKVIKEAAGPEALKIFAERIIEQTKKTEQDQMLRERMMTIVSRNFKGNSSQDNSKRYEVYRNIDELFPGFASVLRMVSFETRLSIFRAIERLAYGTKIISTIDKVGTSVKEVLDAIQLPYEAYKDIVRWWNGEISARRCLKRLVDATSTVVGGIGGGVGGAAIGSFLGPVGTVVGCIIGVLFSATVAKSGSEYLTQELFGIPKDEALENAYNYLGVRMTASTAKTNTAYRRLCLKHHPDKGGNVEKFFILQLHMGIIRAASGQNSNCQLFEY